MKRLLRGLWAFLTSRFLWTLVGLVLLAALIWIFGPLLGVGEARPLESEAARLAVIAALLLLWLVWLVLAQRRAIRANRLFVAEIAAEPPPDPADTARAAVSEKFHATLAELRRRKLGRRFLRDMPWYVIIGPPATGKTTALKQSGLSFPLELADDLHGVGGTRNCDWFFTEDAVLIDTAGRYTEQASAPELDAAEWLGFLDLLKKHRGRRALNGVIVALAVDTLVEGDAAVRAHGRAIRKRLAELMERLEIRLPVYLMLTKADLVRGFEPVFDPLTTPEREQVWGATFPPGARVDGPAAAAELAALAAGLEPRLAPRLEAEDRLAVRAEIFRFPAQLATLAEPLRLLVDTAFGESRYERSAWLRGVYLTSATQEGTPIDRLTAALASAFGLPAGPPPPLRRSAPRSFFLKDLLTRVIFPEAGLGTFDPAAEERRLWLGRGAALGAAALFVAAALVFTLSYLANRGAIAAQADALERLQTALAPAAARHAALEPLDLDSAIAAVTAVEAARVPPPSGAAARVGPSAAAAILRSQAVAYERTLRNILEPRMVALLEATMWSHIRDPEFLLDALRTYRMMTGLTPMDPEFAQSWWATRLPERAPAGAFPTGPALEHHLAALDRMVYDAAYVAPDEALAAEALAAICEIPLAVRAYAALLSDPAVTALPEWLPAAHAGPRGADVLARISGKTLRVGIPGVYTYRGFHDVVLDRLEDVATQAALDRSFAGGCPEGAEMSVTVLAEDILKLYYEDFIAQWDAFLHDVTLAPLPSLAVANENLKDLAGSDSAMRRLLTAVVAETNLARIEAEAAAEGGGAPKGLGRLLSKFGRVGKLAKKGVKFIPAGGGVAEADTSGAPVAEHFAPIRATVEEVDGQPPGLDDAQTALAALAAMLQTIAQSPNPDAALQQQGGLPELIGAVATAAARLPDPLDSWLDGLASEFRERQRDAVVAQLDAIWRADVLPLCLAATAGRYPFEPGARSDVPTADFQRLFGPGGLIDAFTNQHLLPFVDTSGRPWRWRADLGLDAAPLAAFEQARRIRDALFPGGGPGPILSFTLEPTDLSPGARLVTLTVDGQVVTYFHGPTQPTPMTWPKDQTGVASIAFAPLDGSPEVFAGETGAWAWLRMIRAGRLAPTALPEVFTLRLAAGGHHADFALRAASVDNPFDLAMFGRFRCPTRI